METKMFEVRDHATFMPVLCISISRKDGWLAGRAGYSEDRYIIFHALEYDTAHYDPFHWNDRTRMVAHKYIRESWELLQDGDLIDVRVILGETPKSCESERRLLDSYFDPI